MAEDAVLSGHFKVDRTSSQSYRLVEPLTTISVMVNALLICNEAGIHVTIPTEPIGSSPKPLALLDAISEESCSACELDVLYGTTDSCGFSPSCNDRSTSRETAFHKIQASVKGILLASKLLGAGS